MAPHRRTPAGGNGGRSEIVRLSNWNTSEITPPSFALQQRGAITSGLAREIREALEVTAPHEQTALLRWLAETALLRLASREGLRSAATFAYRLADTLATGRANV